MRGNASAALGRFQLAGQYCRSDHDLPRQRLRSTRHAANPLRSLLTPSSFGFKMEGETAWVS
jgi:hypothetical protein